MEGLLTQKSLDLPLAASCCQAAIDKADTMGVRVNVAVVDRSGRVTAFLRHPDAAFHSSDIAVDKAYTAVSFGVPTQQWPEVLSGMSEAVRQGMSQRDRFITFGGGLPIRLGEEIVGAVGVSGASEQEDQACAEAALSAINVF